MVVEEMKKEEGKFRDRDEEERNLDSGELGGVVLGEGMDEKRVE